MSRTLGWALSCLGVPAGPALLRASLCALNRDQTHCGTDNEVGALPVLRLSQLSYVIGHEDSGMNWRNEPSGGT